MLILSLYFHIGWSQEAIAQPTPRHPWVGPSATPVVALHRTTSSFTSPIWAPWEAPPSSFPSCITPTLCFTCKEQLAELPGRGCALQRLGLCVLQSLFLRGLSPLSPSGRLSAFKTEHGHRMWEAGPDTSPPLPGDMPLHCSLHLGDSTWRTVWQLPSYMSFSPLDCGPWGQSLSFTFPFSQ